MISAPVTTGRETPIAEIVSELRALAISGLPMMFDPDAAVFSFRVERREGALVRAGHSRRYTAIAAIGLSGESDAIGRRTLGGSSVRDVVERLILTSGVRDSLGDLALIAWAGQAVGCSTDVIWKQLAALDPASGAFPTVEVAWTLAAAAVHPEMSRSALARGVARRLCDALRSGVAAFPHHLGAARATGRGHVSCFADFVYPVHALAHYGKATSNDEAIGAAVQGGDAMCRKQGPDGQWWWHFDHRTGDVVERYPVYAVHQDSMAPMALLAAGAASGTNYDEPIARGLRWLYHAPELDGGSLVDRKAGLIWRKVARREPAKLSRYIQAGASRLSPRLRAPGLDVIFPPHAIDFEDRAYHLGWVLYAWPLARAAAWPGAHEEVA